MTNQHFELMNTLQNQRDQLARFVWLFAHDKYKVLRTEAVDALNAVDIASRIIQTCMANPVLPSVGYIAENTALIERLNAAVIAMPDGAWAESEAAT